MLKSSKRIRYESGMPVTPVRYFPFPGNLQRSPRCGITLAAAGPMKSGRDSENRSRVLRALGITPSSVLSLSQTHSRVVRIAEKEGAFDSSPVGDGILTKNTELVPCVTVADCMPIYVFDPVTSCFGVLHSGWKGTGIIRSAVELAHDEWGALPSDFRVIFGPHIRSCCYTVDAERADYFTGNFGQSCIRLDAERVKEKSQWPYRLSLAEANRQICLDLGILPEHILDTEECTSCSTEYGSSRRENSSRPDGPSNFTHMAAFISWH